MANIASSSTNGASTGMTKEERKVIFASSLGTVFEWYDFYLYGSLAAIISARFFSGLPTQGAKDVFTLLGFAAGFFVRPFGALVFGRLGDLVGRKYTFLVTIVIMGLSTAVIGFLPSYESVGVLSPILLISLRLLQGLALGGEYGGAATYVAEHAPHGKRGAYTAWIQITATGGLFLSLLVILGCRMNLSKADFEAWGWRIPFLVSLLLLAVSLWIRLQLDESPLFKKMKAEGKTSSSPILESFGNLYNLKFVLLALFGVVAGQAVVWYCGQFYAQIFLKSTLKIDPNTADTLAAVALLFATPFFVVFGSLSDRIGRKKVILAGLALAILTYFPIFRGITHFGNPALEAAMAASPATVTADPAECTWQLNVAGTSKFTSSCDVAKAALVGKSVPYSAVDGGAGSVAQIKIGDTVIDSYDAKAPDAKEKKAAFDAAVADAVKAAGYPAKADDAAINKPALTFLLWVLVIYVTLVYGPIAAMLVEMFPSRIRYTSMSLPYHIGNGWFGGFLPAISLAIVVTTGQMYAGLWYPIIVAAITFVIGLLFVRETKDTEISHDK
ncbi:major facilitator family transporter [Nitrospirillum viridazoti Y2]|uniref:Sugar transport protein n=1 Tax=Nitrospirillum amazonense TaxID=28077 RepID=A0A560HTN8_9PROT|nr:MFS transporter [Nitrospirillum amazonense]EGY02249.1 major facilitator family transporter [Nitrospirillum amazonense Y2]TWB48889.1 sugar transport protein [Nitrospirillum amazonense]